MLEVKPFSPRERRFRELVARGSGPAPEELRQAGEIVEKIRSEGLHGLIELCRGRDDSFDAHTLRYSAEELDAARREARADFLTAFSLARVNLRRFHEHQKRRGFVHDDAGALHLERRVRPLRRVAVCPGTSVQELLHHVVPAQVAGVGEIVAAVQPDDNPEAIRDVLAAARVLGIDTVYRLGGAEAVGTLAYGCDGVRRVDKIVGHGSGAPTEAAKIAVRHRVGVDLGRVNQGELVVLSDRNGKSRFIAQDLLATAEAADDDGLLMLLALDRFLAEAVRIELTNASESLPNGRDLLARIDRFGGLYHAPDLISAIRAVNDLAPARLSVNTRDNEFVLGDIETAGLVAIGPWTTEAAGVTFSGLGLPVGAGGTSAFASGSGVEDFVREFSVVEYGPEWLLKTGRHQAVLAASDSGPAQMNALEDRLSLLKLAVE